MTFKSTSKGIDFGKLLWEQYRIRYGQKWVDYEPWPRQWKIRGIRTGFKGEEIVPVSCCIKKGCNDEYYVYIEEGGVTGYESASWSGLWYHHNNWCANAGGMGYDRLDILKKDLIPMLREMREYVKMEAK